MRLRDGMRVELEVLALAEDVLRDMTAKAENEQWSEHLQDIADLLGDVIDIEDAD